ncbi:MAG: thiamine phosphate synthase [Campylobacteraceae bacterium]|nr:thiamine phosphate synthase [Campylobacteraceae bacterium]
MSKNELLKGIYVLTDASLTPLDTILSQIERVLRLGVSVVQFRDKYASDEALEFTCKALCDLCKKYNALFIIDDRVHLAKKVNADGLHVGEDDISFEEARAILGDKIIGVSCYGDIERAKYYEALGADYVAFGSFFRSPTKPHSKVVPLSVLEEAKKVLKVPICAIGGINADNISEVVKSGIAMYSVISAVYENDTIEDNIQKLQSHI